MFFYRSLLGGLLLFLSGCINDSIDEVHKKAALKQSAIESSVPIPEITGSEGEENAVKLVVPATIKKTKPLNLSLPKIYAIEGDKAMDGRLVKLPDLFVTDDSGDSAVSYRAVPHFKEAEKLLQRPEIDGATLGVDIKIR